MNFQTFGDKKNKSILFIHGMATSAMICYEPILKYRKCKNMAFFHSLAAENLEYILKLIKSEIE